jgi:predicted nucleic acid-binding protein
MHKLNLLEVYYDVLRQCGVDTAESVLRETSVSSIRVIPGISDAVFRTAGRLKASYRISLADAVALAETLAGGGTLVTSDHHEFEPIQAGEDIAVLWIR